LTHVHLPITFRIVQVSMTSLLPCAKKLGRPFPHKQHRELQLYRSSRIVVKLECKNMACLIHSEFKSTFALVSYPHLGLTHAACTANSPSTTATVHHYHCMWAQLGVNFDPQCSKLPIHLYRQGYAVHESLGSKGLHAEGLACA